MDDEQIYIDFFEDQVVFLTGATGGLGGCLLYKLALKLPTRYIYVLCRDSPTRAKARWRKSMAARAKKSKVLGKLIFVIRDMKFSNFSMTKAVLNKVAATTTILIHAAASIALSDDLKNSIEDNCLPSLELARMASSFKHLSHFVQTSSAYCNSFLPNGPIDEQYYDLGIIKVDAELDHIQIPGPQLTLKHFPWPYAYAKYLMEQLLLRRHPELPLLIVRPTIIGPAVYQPYTLYGPAGSNPLDTFVHLLMLGSGKAIFHPPQGQVSCTKIFDEVSVDWVANLTLLHISVGSRGPVHVGSESYVQRTFDDFYKRAKSVNDKLHIEFIQDRTVKQSPLAEFYGVGTRDWRFSTRSSKKLRELKEPLFIDTGAFDIEGFDRMRLQKVEAGITAAKRNSKL